MGLRYRQIVGSLVIGVLVAGAATAAAQTETQKPKVRRWESNLSVGGTANHRLGLIKSFWWFAVPKVLAVGLSADCIFREGIPFSLDVALNAPIPAIRPFVCAGAGGSFSGGTIAFYGGGLKVRLIKTFGLVAEYRRYRYTYEISVFPVVRGKTSTHYFGGGISWVY